MSLYLKFDNEAQAKSVLEIDGESKFVNVHHVGVIVKNGVELDGWHVNLLAMEHEDTGSLLQFAVVPSNPVCVWG